MNTSITGQNVEITPALRNYTQEKFERILQHFPNKITRIEVICTIEKLNHIAEATLHIPSHEIFAKATSEDMYTAINALTRKLDGQIKAYKEKNTDHR